MDKNGVTVKLDVNIESSQTLHLKHYPDFIWYILGIIGILGGAFISLLIDSLFWIYCVIFLVIILYKIFFARAFTCSIDKTTGMIHYHRSGVLMTSFDEQIKEHSITQIQCLEMHRHVKGGQWSWSWFGVDTFQIFLLLDKEQRIPLSPANLDFSDCQDFTEQIRIFLGNEIPVKAIN
ncbi:MAG: hypothetical protein CVU44_07800 [Chloroflexi bacterium HGW-Chloroflexi-6]|nr:MAG: hypothetical protein CVU44_07800 [Chloroflexi bacterium HGW-Chloroflexi-6]